MIITRTPYRISFFGGGTDYPCWYREHGGAVLAASINKYCWITARKPTQFGLKYKLVYSRQEECSDVNLIEHRAARECLRLLAPDGAEIYHSSDLPARSGMGSSSAFVVGLSHALHRLYGHRPKKTWDPFDLADEAIEIEQEILRENVGDQDQITTALGGINIIRFFPDRSPSVLPVYKNSIRSCELQQYLMLFFTGVTRTSSDVAMSYLNNLSTKKGVMRRLYEMVDEGVNCLAGIVTTQFGKLLHEAWELKKQLGGLVTNGRLDAMYGQARGAGAIGGKVLGAGGGGFLLLFVPPDRRESVRQALPGLIEVPFEFETEGSVCYEVGE